MAYAIIKVKKFHNTELVGQRLRKAGGVIQPKLEVLRIRSADDINPSWKAGVCKMRPTSSVGEAGKKRDTVFLPLPSVVFSSSKD